MISIIQQQLLFRQEMEGENMNHYEQIKAATLDKKCSEESKGIREHFFGIKNSKRTCVEDIQTFPAMLTISNASQQPLIHFSVIHRCVRITPNICNIAYKKYFESQDIFIEQDWPFAVDPYEAKYGGKDIFEINFTIEGIEQDLVYMTNFGSTAIQIEKTQKQHIQIQIQEIEPGNISVTGQITYLAKKAGKFGVFDCFMPDKVKVHFQPHNFWQDIGKAQMRKMEREFDIPINNKDYKRGQLQTNFISAQAHSAIHHIRILNRYRGNNERFEDHFQPMIDQSKCSLSRSKDVYSQMKQSYKKKKIVKSRSKGSLMQGVQLGNCYQVSALDQIISQAPEIIQQIYVLDCKKTQYNCIVLNIDGKWIPFEVGSGELATYEVKDNFLRRRFYYSCLSDNTIFNEQSQQYQSIKKAVYIQKSIAKVFRSYLNLTYGNSSETFMHVTNSNTKLYQICPKMDQLDNLLEDMDKWAQNLKRKNPNRMLITVSSPKQTSLKSELILNRYGIHKGDFNEHVYSFYGLYQVSQDIVLMKLRNNNQGISTIWMENWKVINFHKWQQFQKINVLKTSQFILDVQDFLELFEFAEVCEINLNDSYQYLPVFLEDQRISKILFSIQREGYYYISIHKPNLRHMFQRHYKKGKKSSQILENINQQFQKKYVRGKIILKGQSFPGQLLQIQDNKQVTYLKCWLKQDKYQLFVAIQKVQKQWLHISIKGQKADCLRQVCYSSQNKMSFYGDIQNSPKLIIIDNNYSPFCTFVIRCSDQHRYIVLELSSDSPSSQFIQQEIQSFGFNGRQKQLLSFEVDRIHTQKFSTQQELSFSMSYFQYKGKYGPIHVFYMFHQFRKSKYRLNIKMVENLGFWMSSRPLIFSLYSKDDFFDRFGSILEDRKSVQLTKEA